MFIDSAFDLQFVILHKGLVPPSTFGEGVMMCFPGNAIICVPNEQERDQHLKNKEISLRSQPFKSVFTFETNTLTFGKLSNFWMLF